LVLNWNLLLGMSFNVRYCYNFSHVSSHFCIDTPSLDYTLRPIPVSYIEYRYLYDIMSDLGDTANPRILDSEEVRSVAIDYLKTLRHSGLPSDIGTFLDFFHSLRWYFHKIDFFIPSLHTVLCSSSSIDHVATSPKSER